MRGQALDAAAHLPTPSAISSILGTWLDQYSEDFCQPPDFPCLKQLVAYVQLNMPGSDLERRAHLLLAQLEHAELAEAGLEGEEDGEGVVRARGGAGGVRTGWPCGAVVLGGGSSGRSSGVTSVVERRRVADPPPLRAALSPAPAPAPALKPEPEAALAPARASSPLPALELEPEPAPEPESSPAPELEPAPAPEPSWPVPRASENGLSEEKPHLLGFPPDLVAEQFTLMDAVSSPRRGRGGTFLRRLLPSPAVPWARAEVPAQFPAPLSQTV